jgi:hypothetical protein
VRRWSTRLAVLAVLAIAVEVSLISPAGRHQWALSLLRQPTPYTVLSFSHAASLPATAIVNKPIRVSFTVGNHEGRVVDYRYVLTATGGGKSRILGQSKKTIAAGATWTVSREVIPACGTSPCRIEVALPGHPETIDFSVSLNAAAGKHA